MKGRFGIIGEPLHHTLSPRLHRLLHSIPYERWDGKTPNHIVEDASIEAANITAPYKQEMVRYCQHLSPYAAATGVVNLIQKKTDGIHGWNTDVEGFLSVFSQWQLPTSLPVQILGNGATSRSALLACQTYGLTNVTVYARHPNHHETSFDAFPPNPGFVLSTLPSSAWSQPPLPVPLERIGHAQAIMDVGYAPLFSELIRVAQHQAIPWRNGISLLVAQALAGCNHMAIPIDSFKTYTAMLHAIWSSMPIFLIGMPGSGKSTYGQQWAEQSQRTFMDMDARLEKKLGMPLYSFIPTYGETRFRQEEALLYDSSILKEKVIIATGGGSIVTESNRTLMANHGIVLWIDQVRYIPYDITRPLTMTKEQFDDVNAKRTPLYASLAHHRIRFSPCEEFNKAKELEAAYEHYLSTLWSEFKLARST